MAALRKPPPSGSIATASNGTCAGPVDLDETVETALDLSRLGLQKRPPSDSVARLPNGKYSGLVDADDAIDTTLIQLQGNEKTHGLPEGKEETWVNEGLQRWEEARKAWLGTERPLPLRRSKDKETPTPPEPGATALDVDEIIDIIFLSSVKSSSSNNNAPPPRFPVNVALPQMVDILQGKRILDQGSVLNRKPSGFILGSRNRLLINLLSLKRRPMGS